MSNDVLPVGTRSIESLIDDLVGTNRHELIRDCINYQRQLFGFGVESYRSAVVSPEDVFDKLHELSVDELQAYSLALASACRNKAMELINSDKYKQ